MLAISSPILLLRLRVDVYSEPIPNEALPVFRRRCTATCGTQMCSLRSSGVEHELDCAYASHTPRDPSHPGGDLAVLLDGLHDGEQRESRGRVGSSGVLTRAGIVPEVERDVATALLGLRPSPKIRGFDHQRHLEEAMETQVSHLRLSSLD